MAGQDLDFGCRCGTVRGVMHGVAPGTGTRLTCYCEDCQRFATALGAEDTLSPGGGSEIWQTVPYRLEFTAGRDHIACLRLTPNGTNRWYASCCNTPLANTTGPKLRFVGTLLAAYPGAEAPAAMGPVRAVVNVGGATGETKPRGFGMLGLALRLLGRHLVAGFRKGGRRTPFFDDDGVPLAEPRILPRA